MRRECIREGEHPAADPHLPRSCQGILPGLRHELRHPERRQDHLGRVRDRAEEETPAAVWENAQVCQSNRDAATKFSFVFG